MRQEEIQILYDRWSALYEAMALAPTKALYEQIQALEALIAAAPGRPDLKLMVALQTADIGLDSPACALIQSALDALTEIR